MRNVQLPRYSVSDRRMLAALIEKNFKWYQPCSSAMRRRERCAIEALAQLGRLFKVPAYNQPPCFWVFVFVCLFFRGMRENEVNR